MIHDRRNVWFPIRFRFTSQLAPVWGDVETGAVYLILTRMRISTTGGTAWILIVIIHVYRSIMWMEDSSRNSRPVKNWTYKWHQIEPSEQRLRHGHTHTHLYINNHSPSTQFIYILFVPFHLSTCRNNPVRVRNIIEVFFFVIISSSYLFKRSRVQQRNSGGKNRKQRRFTVCWLEAQMLLVGEWVCF